MYDARRNAMPTPQPPLTDRWCTSSARHTALAHGRRRPRLHRLACAILATGLCAMAAGCVQLRGERESYLEARDRVVSMDAAPEAPVTRVATWPGPTHHLALVRAWTPDEGLADSSRLASATPPRADPLIAPPPR